MRTLSVGNLILTVERRGGDDGGPSLHLIVRMPPDLPHQETSRFQQLWRADCFTVKPHEHLFGPAGEVIRDLPASDAERSADWCLAQLANLTDIVQAAGYPKVPECLHDSLLSVGHVATLRQWMYEA